MGKNKRPKSYYVQLAKKQKTHHNVLSPGLTGFLCTCNDRERECVLEAYNILNEYADQLYGKEVMPGNDYAVSCKESCIAVVCMNCEISVVDSYSTVDFKVNQKLSLC